jgi:hypothetical protein
MKSEEKMEKGSSAMGSKGPARYGANDQGLLGRETSPCMERAQQRLATRQEVTWFGPTPSIRCRLSVATPKPTWDTQARGAPW